jgi:hypothetical protein
MISVADSGAYIAVTNAAELRLLASDDAAEDAWILGRLPFALDDRIGTTPTCRARCSVPFGVGHVTIRRETSGRSDLQGAIAKVDHFAQAFPGEHVAGGRTSGEPDAAGKQKRNRPMAHPRSVWSHENSPRSIQPR